MNSGQQKRGTGNPVPLKTVCIAAALSLLE